MDNIVVCIKQVPDTDDIKWTSENNLSREGMLSILNPTDKMALDWAIKLKHETNAKVSVFSMGPSQAKNILEYAYSLGADEAFLLCDKAFAASDTLATGRVLSSAIKKIEPNFDLILCGAYALDGDTAQTGVTVSNMLGIENISYVVDIQYENNMLKIKQDLEDGFGILSSKLPVLLSVQENKNEIIPKIEDYIKAQNKEIHILGIDNVGVGKDECGILGSPTFVSKVFRKQANRKCEIIEWDSAQTLLDRIKLMRENV